MKHLLSVAAPTKKVEFMGVKDSVEIRKLTGLQVKTFQAKVKEIQSKKGASDEDQGLEIQRMILRLGVVGAEELTDDEIDNFPLDDVSKLAVNVLSYSGIDVDSAKEAATAKN